MAGWVGPEEEDVNLGKNWELVKEARRAGTIHIRR